MKDHWNGIYNTAEQTKLGWYQADPEPDLQMILDLNLPLTSRIVIVGVGTSTLVDRLFDHGYHNLVLVDISRRALQKLKERLSSNSCEMIEADLGKDQIYDLIHGQSIELWHDRAALHFLLEDDEVANYKENLALLEPNYVFLAQFSTRGAKKCSGLSVRQYDQKSLRNMLDYHYQTVEMKEYIYVNPSGDDRPYIYGIFNLTHEE